MSTANRNRTISLYNALYWVGVAMSLACFALVLASNTDLVWRFEHTRFPLSWACAAAAVLAFVATEFCEFAFSVPSKAADKSPQLSRELEAVEY